MTRTIALATQNKGKITEFERLLAEYASDIQVLGLADFPGLPDVEESGSTFAENSLLKARAVSAFTGLPALADDSGLCIDVLGGAPGIYSARYSGVHCDDKANIAKVLSELEGRDIRSFFRLDTRSPWASLARGRRTALATEVKRYVR